MSKPTLVPASASASDADQPLLTAGSYLRGESLTSGLSTSEVEGLPFNRLASLRSVASPRGGRGSSSPSYRSEKSRSPIGQYLPAKGTHYRPSLCQKIMGQRLAMVLTDFCTTVRLHIFYSFETQWWWRHWPVAAACICGLASFGFIGATYHLDVKARWPCGTQKPGHTQNKARRRELWLNLVLTYVFHHSCSLPGISWCV